MKAIKLVSVTLFIFIFLFGACKKDEDPLDENTIVLADTSAFTGDLLVQVNHWDGSHNIPSEWGFEVNLYFSRQDADDNMPYLTVKTDNAGEAYFGFLLNGEYYIKGTGSYNGQNYQSDLTPTQVMPRRTNFTVINIKKP